MLFCSSFSNRVDLFMCISSCFVINNEESLYVLLTTIFFAVWLSFYLTIFFISHISSQLKVVSTCLCKFHTTAHSPLNVPLNFFPPSLQTNHVFQPVSFLGSCTQFVFAVSSCIWTYSRSCTDLISFVYGTDGEGTSETNEMYDFKKTISKKIIAIR